MGLLFIYEYDKNETVPPEAGLIISLTHQFIYPKYAFNALL